MNRRILGRIACVTGLMGVLATVLAHHVIARVAEQPPGWEMEVNVADGLQWRFGNLPPAAPKPAPLMSRDGMTLVAIGIGCVAITFAVASWIRREGIALGVLASFLGTAAIAWEQVVFVLALFIFAGGPVVWVYWPRAEHQRSSDAT